MYMRTMLLEQVPQHHQRAVYTALMKQRPLVGEWAERDTDGCGDKGCPNVVTAYAMTNQPISYEQVYSYADIGNSAIESFLATMTEGITARQLRKARKSWDNASNQQRGECLSAIRRKLASLPPDNDSLPVIFNFAHAERSAEQMAEVQVR
jgi:hypothetical protein